jgi:Omp85 superfamily domain
MRWKLNSSAAPLAALVLLSFSQSIASAQSPAFSDRSQQGEPPSWAQGFVVVAPGPQYAKGALSAALRGRHYRDLWATPIRVPVLDLRRFAGGLVPISAHSGSQTKSLLLRGADGREYQFRSVDKDPTATLAPELRTTAYGKSLRDGVSASFPAAPLVANALLEAGGVMSIRDTLALMPDDPGLGEFRSAFKGVLGLIEQRPSDAGGPDGSSGAPVKVISPTKLFQRIDASPDDRVDARAFLRARLMDIFMGDRDRHRDQFRWAAIGNGHPTLWQPISRDHDEAFVQLDGPALDIARLYYPPLVTFRPKYPAHFRLNWHAREVDRRFLVGLDRAAWDSVATELQRTLTDSTIEAAVRRMPPEMYQVGGERLARVLRARRDGLEREALSYYEFLTREVEIRATDAPEVAELTRVDPHHMDLTIRTRDEARPYIARRFDDRETREIRLKMWGGDDQVVVRGTETPQIRLKVVGGAGDDAFLDSTRSGRPKFYDDQGHNTAGGERKVAINTKPYQEWVGSDTNRYPPREWGTLWRPAPWMALNNDLGLFIGGGFQRTEYGFRRAPFASEIRARIGYSTGAQSVRADLDGEFHPENTSHFWRLHVLGSGIETLHYYGQGNDTPNLTTNDFYRVRQQRYALEPAFLVPIGRSSEVGIGIFARYTHTGDNAGRFIAAIQDTLLGGDNFGELGGRLTFDYDTRDRRVNPLHGIHLSAAGELHPAVWDVNNTFGSAQAEATTFVSAKMPLTPTLALRAGGRRVWGSYPFFESAFLGGSSTLAGFHSNRFAGDASLYGGAQIRLTMGHAFIALPAVWGLFGAADAGRVYLDGKSPGGWHAGGGGGIWLALLDRNSAVSFGVNSSEEGTLFQVGTAFGF